jgi:Winged helix DNA-binding domain
MSAGPVLDERTLGRTLLARQCLLARTNRPLADVIDQVGGLQTQYAPSGYVGLWTRLAVFEREMLTRALEDRSVIQATLMRTTIHMVSRTNYWAYAMGVRQARRTWALRLARGGGAGGDEAAMRDGAEALRSALADGPRTVKELGSLATGFPGDLGLWVDLVRVPPSGTWERRRADRIELAERWVGPPDATEDEGRTFLVRAYLAAFGPAPWKDIALWAGMSAADVRGAGERLTLDHYRDAAGRPLVDLPDAPIADGGAAAPVRFLPHWDALLLVHARRTGVLPEYHRAAVFSTRNPFSVGTVLVGGHVAATWSMRDGRIDVTELEPFAAADRDAMEAERAALERFHA